jgi:hypothetical protein
MEENRPARDFGAKNPNIPQGHDYEYDEAHDVPAGPPGGIPAPYRVDPPPPTVNLARAGTMDTTRPTIRRPMNNQNLTSRRRRSLRAPAK